MMITTETQHPSIAERLFCVLFVGLSLLVPVMFEDLYPFTSMPMFSDATQELGFISIHNMRGESLPLEAFYLQQSFLANPSPKLGLVQHQSFYNFKVPINREEITLRIIQGLRSYCDSLEGVDVRTWTVRATPRPVGIKEREDWRIMNPCFHNNRTL